MSTVIACLLIMMMLPIVWSWVGGYHRYNQFNEIDNKTPRLQNEKLTGAGHRACAAQANAWEALMMVLASLMALALADINLASVSTMLMALVACRVLHGVFYLVNQDVLRSLAFLGGFGINIYFFYIALSTVPG
jgi:uncharacterized MAPEG superfamily protein